MRRNNVSSYLIEDNVFFITILLVFNDRSTIATVSLFSMIYTKLFEFRRSLKFVKFCAVFL